MQTSCCVTTSSTHDGTDHVVTAHVQRPNDATAQTHSVSLWTRMLRMHCDVSGARRVLQLSTDIMIFMTHNLPCGHACISSNIMLRRLQVASYGRSFWNHRIGQLQIPTVGILSPHRMPTREAVIKSQIKEPSRWAVIIFGRL